MSLSPVDRLVRILARLPGLGNRSARRVVLFLLKRREELLLPLIDALGHLAETIKTCSRCGNLDTSDPCGICTDPKRDGSTLCVLKDVADLWALERTAGFRGRYHVLGGVLSALDGVSPEDLNISPLLERIGTENVSEVILALPATVEGQTTAHYLTDRLAEKDVDISGVAHGIPVGGEFDYLDDGTIQAALSARRKLGETA